MGRLSGLGTFLAAAAIVVVALRLLHIGVPLVFPQVLPGPFILEDFEEVERYTRFTPLVPFYRPEVLGPRPRFIRATRRPQRQLTCLWRGEYSLRMAQRMGGGAPRAAPSARPFEGVEGSLWWREGDEIRATIEVDGLWVEVQSDLAIDEVRRIVSSLRPL